MEIDEIIDKIVKLKDEMVNKGLSHDYMNKTLLIDPYRKIVKILDINLNIYMDVTYEAFDDIHKQII